MNSEKLLFYASRVTAVLFSSSPDGAAQPQLKNGSEMPLKKMRTNLSTTCARKSPGEVLKMVRRMGGLVRLPSSAPSSPKTLTNTMKTTASGGITSTTLSESTTAFSLRSIMIVRPTGSFQNQSLMKFKIKRPITDLQLPC